MLPDCVIFRVSPHIYVCTIYNGLFAIPLGVIGRLCSVTVAIPGHLLSDILSSSLTRLCLVDSST